MRNLLLPWFTAALTVFAVAPTASADRININLAEFHDTDTGFDGEGILGGGVWNRINFAQAALANPMVNSDGNATGITATETSFGNPAGATQDGNDVQDESWGNHRQEDSADREVPVELTVAGLIPGQIYKVAVYSDRLGTESGSPDNYTVNGQTKSLPNPGDGVDIPLPGIEGVDFAVFVVSATSDGRIVVSAPFIAAVQIENSTEDSISKTGQGPQMDCRISGTSAGAGGKGNGIYAFRIRKDQALVKQTTGRRAKRFFVNIENDGEEADECYATGNWAQRAASVRVIDRQTGKNVTAAFRAANYRYNLGKNGTRRFKVVVKPTSPRPTTIYVPICASPSTRVVGKMDCVTCKLKVR